MDVKTPQRFGALREKSYRLFLAGYGFSYTLYWVTLLAIGWWVWETTQSASWVGFIYFCDLFPAVLVTPWASAIADRSDRFKLLKIVLWIQVFSGLALAAVAAMGHLTPYILAAFVFLEGALIGFSQPAFFGMINRLVSKPNLSAAVALNTSVSQASYTLGPLIAAFFFSFGLWIAPLAFAANAIGTLVYLFCLTKIKLQPVPLSNKEPSTNLMGDIIEGIIALWASKLAFRATVLILAVAILQRPLISLMPGINSYFDLFSASNYTFLTASFMVGSIVAGLVLANRNNEHGLEAITLKVIFVLMGLYFSFFLLMNVLGGFWFVAIGMLFAIGFTSAFVWSGNNIILQNKIPEHLRSRVLGNNFMLTRAIGAIAVIISGFLVDVYDFPTAMIALVGIVLVALFVFRSLKSTSTTQSNR
ncbi:MAG: MFS transporter [Sulfitobacter sp.]